MESGDDERMNLMDIKIEYSTEKEKEKENKGVQYAYLTRDRAMRYMLAQGLVLAFLFCMSLFTMRDSFSCSGSHTECDTLRSKLACKS